MASAVVYQQYKDVTKKNPFYIQVACEANSYLKEMLEDGNTTLVQPTAQAANGTTLMRGVPRPQHQYVSQEGQHGPLGKGQHGPPFPDPWEKHKMSPYLSSKINFDRTWRCTLGETANGLTESRFTNMCAVQDKHCAEYDPSEGKGLKPPTCNEHLEIPHDQRNRCISRLTHFTVHLRQQIGHIGFELRVLVGHFHSEIAGRTYQSPESKNIMHVPWY